MDPVRDDEEEDGAADAQDSGRDAEEREHPLGTHLTRAEALHRPAVQRQARLQQPDVRRACNTGRTIHRCIDISRYFSRDTYRDIFFFFLIHFFVPQ